jgi:hypothetical protein
MPQMGPIAYRLTASGADAAVVSWGKLTEESVGRLRHFAMSVPDPWKTAAFTRK